MGRQPRDLTPWESALHAFGAELRHWRTRRELSQNGLGLLSHDSGSLISKIEKAERFPTLIFAQGLDQVLDTDGVLERLWPQVESERAGRTAAPSIPTDSGAAVLPDLGLRWPVTTAATVEVVGRLWRADLERRAVLISAAWVATAFADPIREWMLNRQDDVLQERSGRAVGQSDIDALWAMCEAFTDADQRLGGGYARATLMDYVNQIVLPLLHGSYSYSDTIGRELMAAAARLCNLCGFMSYDSGRQGLAQRYYIQALRLAKISKNRELGAGILADMSMQAHHLKNAAQALELADAGYRTALSCGALSIAARCAALQSEAYALQGEQRACAQACTTAERTLDRIAPENERTWVKRFTTEHLAAGRLYLAGDLGRYAEVQRLAPDVLADADGMQRRNVKCMTVFVTSHLPADNNPRSDIDRACELLSQTLPTLGSLHSALNLERINAIRRELAAHAHRPSVREFEDRFRTTVASLHLSSERR